MLAATGRRVPWLLAAIAALAALASEAGRILIKGQDYAFSSFNDIHFYTAMAFNLWGDPVSVGQEVTDRGFTLSPEEWSSFFGGTNPFWATHIHPENGLSHQPPWSYRILVPSVAGLIRIFGLPLDVAFIAIYVTSAVLLTVATFLLLRPFVRQEWWAVLVSLGVLTAALAATSSGYPDMTFLGLAMLAVLFAYRQNGLAFALVGFLASMTRETGLLLCFSWIGIAWANGRVGVRSAMPAMGPIVGVLLVRIFVQVPNPHIDYLGMVADASKVAQTLAWAFLPLVVIGLVSPRLVGISRPLKHNRIAIAELFLLTVGTLFVLVSGMFGLATSRMALLALPLFIAPASWNHARSLFWLVAAMAATLGYAAGDTLAFRADPFFGQLPWLVGALLVVGLQLVARSREAILGPGRRPVVQFSVGKRRVDEASSG